MSKKITHKEHRQLLSELYKKQGGKWIYQADAYIKQQEKQEKLLELYKGYYEINETNSIVEFLKRTDEFELVKTKIKELENEKENE